MATVSMVHLSEAGNQLMRAICSIIPDPKTMFLDPFIDQPTISLICDVYEPATKEKYTRCPVTLHKKLKPYLSLTGLPTQFFTDGSRVFYFRWCRFDSQPNSQFYFVDSIEGRWNSGRDEGPNLGYKPRFKEGYFPVPPTDALMDLRNEMVTNLMNCGIDVEAQHHEVASGGQCEIDLRFQPLVKSADQLLMFK